MNILNYKNGKNNIDVDSSSFLCVIGNTKDSLLTEILTSSNSTVCGEILDKKKTYKYYKNIGVVRFKELEMFENETVGDILAFGLENRAVKRKDMLRIVKLFSKDFNLNTLLDKDPYSLNKSEKVLMKIASVLITKPALFMIDDAFDYLNVTDKNLVIKELNEFVKSGSSVIVFTSNAENILLSNRVIVHSNNTIYFDGNVIDAFNEEKLLRRLGIGYPFIAELNKYLMDYDLIDKYYLNNKELVEALWK